MAHLWHFSVVQFDQYSTVFGTVLKGEFKSYNSTPKGLSNAIRTGRSYFKYPLKNKDLQLKTGQRTLETRTDSKGNFATTIEHVDLQDFRVFTKEGDKVSLEQTYPVLFDFKNVNTLVISDIDDTIMRSYTSTKIKRLLTTLFRPAHKRIKVQATEKLFQQLASSDTSFCYVSKSELNLARLIGDFIQLQNLPEGPLLLTPYLSFSELVKNIKDPEFKFKSISWVMDQLKNTSVVLIGDDTQADMDVYARIVDKYGRQIEKVYIRQTGKAKSVSQSERWENLVGKGITSVYYNDDPNTITVK